MSGHVQDLWYTAGQPTARHGRGKRWKARYRDPDDRERGRSFGRRADAERFLTEVEHSKIAGSYLDPDAGRVTLASRVPQWLAGLTCDPTTRKHVDGRVTKHVLGSALAGMRLDTLSRSPSAVQAWVAGLPVAPSYARQVLADLSSVLDAAVADGLIARNPCRAATVRVPRQAGRKLVPWARERVAAVRAQLPERYRAMTDAGAGLGLRQGEVFGLALDEVDWLRRIVHVRRQVKLYHGTTAVYAAPKGGKPRAVPLPRQVAEALAVHVEKYPPRPVTLPWEVPDGKPQTHELLFTGTGGRALNRAYFNRKVWVPARRRAGVPDGDGADAAGTHQLRHHYASLLLRGGVDIKRLSAWLGHHDPAFTLRVYSHLMSDDEAASLRQIEAALDSPCGTHAASGQVSGT